MNREKVQELFLLCEYPYYKKLNITDQEVCFTLYSIYTNFKRDICLYHTDDDQLLHQMAIEIIKFQSEELLLE